MAHFTGSDSFFSQSILMAKTRILISTHGMVLAQSMYMEPGGVVMELNGYQFNYPLYQRIVANYGHYYMRHEVALVDSKIQGFNTSFDPYAGSNFQNCSKSNCYADRRDADIRVQTNDWRRMIQQAIALVSSETVPPSA